MDKDKLYKQHVLEAAEKIERYLRGVEYEKFLKDDLLKDGVIHELQIIGEAAKRLSPSFKDKYDLPWIGIAGIRDKIVHDYFTVNLKIIWDTAKNDVSALKQKLR